MAHKKSLSFLQIIQVLVLVHAFLFILYWLTNRMFYADVNDFPVREARQALGLHLIRLAAFGRHGMWSSLRLLFFRSQGYKLGWGAWVYPGCGCFLPALLLRQLSGALRAIAGAVDAPGEALGLFSHYPRCPFS